jgi:hypothetical protein
MSISDKYMYRNANYIKKEANVANSSCKLSFTKSPVGQRNLPFQGPDLQGSRLVRDHQKAATFPLPLLPPNYPPQQPRVSTELLATKEFMFYGE